MSEQLIQDDADLSLLSDIEAEVSWTVSNRPPEVELSFEGLHEPVDLWTKLTAIGWVVPGMPPRPANAIEWTPDPVAGTDFTVLPWRVADFRLEEGEWTVNEDEVGAKTLDALLDSGATIIGTSDQITQHAQDYELRKSNQQQTDANPIAPLSAPDAQPFPDASPVAQPSPSADKAQVFGVGSIPNPMADAEALLAEPEPSPAATSEPAAAVASDRTEVPSLPESNSGSRIVLLLNFPSEHDPIPDAGTWKGISGLQKTVTAWSELSLPQDEAIPGHQNMASHVANGAAAWYADTDQPLATNPGSGRRIVRVLIPDLTVNDAKVRRMNKLLGDEIETHQLRSLIGGEATAVLVSAVVNANSFEMLKSNLSLRMPKAVVRIPA